MLSDTFPGVTYQPTNVDELKKHVAAICQEQNYLVDDGWLEKLIQIYQVQNIQHGMMMVGPSASGKTVAWKVLLAALERLEGTEGVSYVIDPKAMSKDQLYGTLDTTTREWNDGLFTHILRKIVDNVRGESNKRHWIVFDGDVDPEWVENLNRYVNKARVPAHLANAFGKFVGRQQDSYASERRTSQPAFECSHHVRGRLAAICNTGHHQSLRYGVVQ